MKLPIACTLLVVSAILVTGTDAWAKKIFKKVGDVAKTLVEKEAIKGITTVVKKYGPSLAAGAAGAIGKRSVDWGALLGKAGKTLAGDLINELNLACTQFSSLKGKKGLTAEDLGIAFDETDGNRDGELNDQELGLFENTVDAVQHCLQLLKTQG